MSTTAGRSATNDVMPLPESHNRRVNAARACINEARVNIATCEFIGPDGAGRTSDGYASTLTWARTALDRAVQCLDGLDETIVTWELREWIREESAKLDALDDAEPEPEPTYSIVRFRQSGGREVMSTGHTLAEVQEHCGRDDTHGPGWFDGYTAE